MGRLNYWLDKPISLSAFNKQLDKSPVISETNYRPRLPFVRLWYYDLKMVAQTNIHGDVVKLKPLDAHTERHFMLAQAIADLCETTIIVDDQSGRGPEWAKKSLTWLDQPDSAEKYGFPPSIDSQENEDGEEDAEVDEFSLGCG